MAREHEHEPRHERARASKHVKEHERVNRNVGGAEEERADGLEPVDEEQHAGYVASGSAAGEKRDARDGASRKQMKRARRRVGQWLVDRMGPLALGLLSKTWRATVEGEEHIAAARGPQGGHFMALWHGRMIVPLARYGHRNWHVLVSPSADGDISESLLEGFGYTVVRGSSSRGGARALRAMLTILGRGGVLAITPDGPRGPRHAMNPGLAWMARATGHAIVPCGYVCHRAWRMQSWDRFTIPKPFARLAFVYEPPIRVPRAATSADLERVTREIHDAMMRAEKRGFELLAAEPDW